MVVIHLDKDAPATMMILGAALSGGDPMLIAKGMVKKCQEEKEK